MAQPPATGKYMYVLSIYNHRNEVVHTNTIYGSPRSWMNVYTYFQSEIAEYHRSGDWLIERIEITRHRPS